RGQRPLWMIWARRGDELDVAFYDGVDRRPEDFGPRRKLVVLTLVPARAASAALDPCQILRGAGVDRLLGGPTLAKPAPQRASTPGSTCALDRTDGSSAISPRSSARRPDPHMPMRRGGGWWPSLASKSKRSPRSAPAPFLPPAAGPSWWSPTGAEPR